MLKQRIEILKNGGVIDADVAEFVDRTIDIMNSDYPQIDMDRAAMFTTHLAMATQRIRTGEAVEMMDDGMWQEITEAPEYPQAREFADKMFAATSIEFPECERRFLLLHICNMLAQ